MKWIVILAILCSAAIADDITTLSGEVYKDAEITRVEPSGLVVATDAGIVRIPFTNLPEDVRKANGYDPKAAAEYAAQSARAQQAIQAKIAADRAAARERAKEAAREAASARNTEDRQPARGEPDPSARKFGSSGLGDKPAKKYTLFGEVVQRTTDGLLISCQVRKGVSGNKQVEGLVWLRGFDISEGTTVKIFAVSDGTMAYKTVTGAERVTDVYRYASGGKTSAPLKE